VGHLNTLYAKYKDKGVVLIAVTNEPRGLVDAFVAKNSPTYPIVIESGDSGVKFGISGYPTQFVIAPDGKIAANNGFHEQLIQDLIPKQRMAPTLPEKFAAVQKLLDKDKLADARKALEAAAAGRVTEDEKKAADDYIQWIDDGGTASLAEAAEAEKAMDFGAAAETYQDLTSRYAGLDPAVKATEAMKAMLADPAKKREVDAAKALDKARTAAADENMAKKKAAIYKAVAAKWKDTKAGAKAAKLADDLEHPKGK
jgi:hypothetical protein